MKHILEKNQKKNENKGKKNEKYFRKSQKKNENKGKKLERKKSGLNSYKSDFIIIYFFPSEF